ncbi:hypothetical protein CHS0354_016503 [Potamilus streckersoni]|uniref:Uncharacterized protein n=1 Tax=Potamilus streckersoni TaxID=2493646 RepID=A0AAE0SIR4_9BIVA|nr:hypothetical protein CHS0354_016503 [Potamilus streckersoni]
MLQSEMLASERHHKPGFIALILACVAIFILTMVFNGLAGKAGAVFQSSTGDLSDKYYLNITPAGWTFSIWGFIYTWQALWLLYSTVLIFRKTDNGPAYLNPEVLPPTLFMVYFINFGLNIAWLFLWDREIIAAAFPVLFLTAFTLYICLFLVYRSTDKYATALIKENRKYDVWLVRLLVHNGLAIYATWTSVATLLNLAHTIAYKSSTPIDQNDASTVALSVLSAEIAAFYSTDIFFLDRYSRYTFTPYIVLIVALSGSVAKNYTYGTRNSIFIAVLLAIAIAMGIVKLVVLIWRHVTKPIYDTKVFDEVKSSHPHGTVEL